MIRLDVANVVLTALVAASFIGATIALALDGKAIAAAILTSGVLLILGSFLVPWDRGPAPRCEWCDRRHRGRCKQQG